MNKQPQENQNEEEILSSMKVLPWRIPPMGSHGDAWDNFISLPEEKFVEEQKQMEELQEKRRKKKSGKLKNRGDVIFKELETKLHPAFVIAAVFTGFAFASVGPVYPLMPFMALCALLAAVTGVTLVQTIQKDKEGQKLGAGIIVICLSLIAISEMSITSSSYITFTQQDLSVPVTTLSPEEKLDRASKDMVLMAEAVSCALEILSEEEIIGLGRESVNSVASNKSISYPISSILLRKELDREFSPIEEEFVFLMESGKFPTDPFADDPRATYGVYISKGFIIIYSPGPDGEWQLNPRRPVMGREDDVVAHLDQFQAKGGGTGDLIYALPVELNSGLSNDKDCDDIRTRWQDAWFNKQ